MLVPSDESKTAFHGGSFGFCVCATIVRKACVCFDDWCLAKDTFGSLGNLHLQFPILVKEFPMPREQLYGVCSAVHGIYGVRRRPCSRNVRSAKKSVNVPLIIASVVFMTRHPDAMHGSVI